MQTGGASLDIGVYGARGLPSTYSGYETFLGVLLPELVARGHAVTIYCRKGEVPVVPEYQGVRCVQLPCIRSRELSTLSHGFVSAARSRLSGHDVVLVVNVANSLSGVLLRATGGRLVLNTDGLEWKRGKWGPVAQWVFWWSARLSRLAANALVADCAAMRTVYLEEFHADSTVIPYCWTGLEPAADRAEFDRLGIRPREYLLVAGRLIPENNITEIADAYLRLELPYPLVVIGAAPARSQVSRDLERMAGRDKRLRLGGHIDDRRVFASLVSEARVYVHGHSVGGMNPSLVEAMGCGARIAALDTAFNRETLGPEGTYFTLLDGVRGVGAVIASTVEEPVEAGLSHRNVSRTRATERFALEHVTDAYEKLLSEVARLPTPWAHTRLSTCWEHAATDL